MHCIETRHSRRWMSLQSWSICHLEDLKINDSALVLNRLPRHMFVQPYVGGTLCHWRKSHVLVLGGQPNYHKFDLVNFFLQPRGPDLTTHTRLHGFDFVHNLLHMTGDRRPQPFLSSDGQIVALFNGEIYNWRQLSLEAEGKGFPPFTSDGEAILPMLLFSWRSFPFSIAGGVCHCSLWLPKPESCILPQIPLAQSPFGMPYCNKNEGRGFILSKSGLVRLGFGDHEIHMVGPNRVLTICLDTFRLIKQTAVFEFDMRQFKNSTEDYINAFNTAVKLRTRDLEETGRPLFVGLSSGFDSGLSMLPCITILWVIMLSLYLQRRSLNCSTTELCMRSQLQRFRLFLWTWRILNWNDLGWRNVLNPSHI